MELLKAKPLSERRNIASGLRLTNRDRDNLRKRDERSESARIVIPDCKNLARREACLADPERFLRTYFADKYRLAFGADHLFMIDTIVSRARNGGRQAVAAPRGRGKSELTKGLLVFLVLAGLVRFPLPVAATTELAGKIYRDFKKKIRTNDLLLEDFPEVCWPVRALEGAPQRAERQHIDGQLTNIVWTGDYINLPTVTCENAVCKTYGGVKMTYYGLDAAFRGANIDASRPDFVLVDDPETRESAKSHSQAEDREAILDQDIAGLASQEENLAIVVLTTVQNTYSLSYRLTDLLIKPSYNGKRFGMVLSWPTNVELWQQYIDKRKQSQISGDEHGALAVDFYLANWDAMNEGVEMLSEHFVQVEVDGRQLVLSAIQQAYNKIADTNRDAYFTEYQNDPPKQTGPQGTGISVEIVANRLSGLSKGVCPASTRCITVGVDVGKYYLHYTVCAWWPGAGGCVIDYGTEKVYGTEKNDNDINTEREVFEALVRLRERLLANNYVDQSEAPRKIDAVYIDSGAYTHAVYKFVREVGRGWYAVKGQSNYRQRSKSNSEVRVGEHQHEQVQEAFGVRLTEVDADHWKTFVHERFLTPTFDEQNMLRRGSLSLFSLPDGLTHTSFAEQTCGEQLMTEFIEGKPPKIYWYRLGANHWLDSTAYASAATERFGIGLLTTSEIQLLAKEKELAQKSKPKPRAQQHGKPLPRNPSGWMQRVRRR